MFLRWQILTIKMLAMTIRVIINKLYMKVNKMLIG